ncbi:MAG: magnesium chelatase family protein [Gammaproteobacteria bacterium]|jgi:magnesium chelatase family protein|nr:magnesium chelatase family protein [Gammaproteobacteria bacterium]
MSIATVACRAQLGLHAPLVQVEVSLDSGLPAFSIVGLAATVVKESKDRVRAAIVNSNFDFPAGRITINLSPADIPKRGGRFDLPIALGILVASGQLKINPACPVDPEHREFYGELGLNGELRSVPGMLLAAAHAARMGHEVLVPQSNADEVRVLLTGAVDRARSGPVMRAADHLLTVCAHINGSTPLPTLSPPLPHTVGFVADTALDLSEVRGQVQAKRALTVAAAGGHSLLMRGSPGSGKSMLAMRLPGLLPPMTEAESLEVAAIASASGIGFNVGSFGRRPVRTPHHTASAVSLVGGGAVARPGEISLAHHGVLFLDELLEYDRRALEALREPLESGVVSISRATHHTQYPAQFQLIAAMNPCPCGRFGDPLGSCNCTPGQIAQYLGRVSGPLLERFDIHLEVPRVNLSDFDDSALPSETSATVAARVKRARETQLARQGTCNARLVDAQIERLCSPDKQARSILNRAMERFGFSARSRQRILKLARTVADLSGDATLGEQHMTEAMTYRTLDRRPPPPKD